MNAKVDALPGEDERAGSLFTLDSAIPAMPDIASPHAEAPARGRLLVPDVVKGTAAQVIALHHFCFFGPMSDAAWGFAPFLFKWLANYGRLSVQCFLVMAGFMAAAALLPGGAKPWAAPRFAALPKIIFGRYKRLAKVYFIGLAAALLCAATARVMVDDPSIPAAPDFSDLLAHLFFAQDVLGVPALTAGAWYMAIDLQLYAMLALICACAGFIMKGGRMARFVALALVGALALSSLLVFNRYAELEVWGIYFFGSYGFGIAAYWVSRFEGKRKAVWALVMALVCATALLVQWRSRIALSGVTALTLVLFGTYRAAASSLAVRLFSYLSRISFPLFVLHYPVYMLVGAVVTSTWDDDPTANLAGLALTWALAMVAATLVAAWLDPVAKPAADKAGAAERWSHATGLARV